MKKSPKEENYFQKWKKAEERSFKGWDFSAIAGESKEDVLPWNYKEIVEKHLKPQNQLLDMGTGGGEFLLTLNHPYSNTAVTEGYPPNYELCINTLGTKGIRVEKVEEDDQLPFFKENAFDVVINRHESFDPKEVFRVLKKGGKFITQQVGGDNNHSLAEKILGKHESPFPHIHLKQQKEGLEKAGFQIVKGEEAFPLTYFYTMEALIYYMKIIPWEFPDFSVESHFKELLVLQKEWEKQGEITTREERFILIGEKPL